MAYRRKSSRGRAGGFRARPASRVRGKRAGYGSRGRGTGARSRGQTIRLVVETVAAQPQSLTGLTATAPESPRGKAKF